MMDGSVSPGPGGHPVRPSERIDAACDRFEAAWRAGPVPRIEDYLAAADEADRPALLRELVALERELRRRRGERPAVEEYLARFPDHAAEVRAAFGAPPDPDTTPAARVQRDTGRNLLFGILALQNNFIGRDDLLAAFAAWVADKDRPLAQLLMDRGALDDVRRALLEALVAEHLKQHGGDTEASLAAVSSLGSVRDDLQQLGDPDLQASLAATTSRAGGDAAGTATYTPSAHRAGARFRIVRFHREGGLGRVYRARDEELGREVALKEIRPDKAAEPDLRSRFVLEAEINGGLEHPGIVPVYSLGTYDDGRPFYAMRFVEGDSLKEAIEDYHQEHPRPDPSAVEFRKLLGRFVDVCEAIAFAHSKGVLHRDLKPQNVMLGRYGETLLIDWGLAKATGHREPVGPESAREATLVPPSGSGHAPTLGVLGSPPYMSPEQAAGEVESLRPATDVYGLGAIMFALLTGEAPVEGRTTDEVLDQVRRGAIRSPRLLNPRIPRALEAICLKALAHEPGDRYPTARALADDVQRWLADEPVTAWREPRAVRLFRWGRRHRPLVTGLLVALFVTSACMSVAAVLLSKERDRAVENLRESRRVVGAMFDKVVPKLADQRDMDATQRDILESALQFYEGFVLRRDRDPEVRHEVGRAYQRVGFIQDRLGRSQAAEAAYLRGVAILGSLVTAHPTHVEYRRTLAATFYDLARLYDHLGGRPAEAEQAFRRSLGLRLELAGDPAADPGDRLGLARGYYGLALLLDRNSRWGEAEDLYQRAVNLQEKLAADFPENREYRSDLANSLYEMGYLFARTDRRPEATRVYERLVAIQEGLLSDFPGAASYQYSLTASLSYLGTLYRHEGRLAEAEQAGRRAVSVQEELVAKHPDVPLYRDALAKHYINQGNFYLDTARLDEAGRFYERALRISERLAREHPERIDYVLSLGSCHGCLGQASEYRGDLSEALGRFDRAIEVYQSALRQQPGHAECRRHLGESYEHRATTLTRRGRLAEALTDWDRAIALTDDPEEAEANKLGRAVTLAHLGDYTRALGEAANLTSRTTNSGIAYYWAACIEALYSAAVLRDPLLRPAERDTLLARYADRAMASLKRAEASGLFRLPAHHLELLRERALDPLRTRPDFQDLLRDLAFPNNPFAP
jgi:serine/threonine-protein kinase